LLSLVIASTYSFVDAILPASAGDFKMPDGYQGSTLWNDKYSRGFVMVHRAPLISAGNCSYFTGTAVPMPARARAENAAAVVCPWPFQR
jgi:hypothetical protein